MIESPAHPIRPMPTAPPTVNTAFAIINFIIYTSLLIYFFLHFDYTKGCVQKNGLNLHFGNGKPHTVFQSYLLDIGIYKAILL